MLQTPGAPRPRTRSGRTLAAVVIAAALLVPALPATAVEADNAVLRVGTTQDLDSMNPFDTALVVGFEVFTLNYELLVGYGQDLTPVSYTHLTLPTILLV